MWPPVCQPIQQNDVLMNMKPQRGSLFSGRVLVPADWGALFLVLEYSGVLLRPCKLPAPRCSHVLGRLPWYHLQSLVAAVPTCPGEA